MPATKPLGLKRWFPGWKMALFVAFFLPLLLVLGTWQLQRASYKDGLQNQLVDRLAALPLSGDELLERGADNAFVRVELTGRGFSDQRYFLIDNQVRAGKPGYWVIAPLADESGRVWLVNRGWIAAPPRRDALPVVPDSQANVTVTGVVWPDTGLVPQFAADEPGGWPRRLQRLDTVALTALSDELSAGSVVPLEIRLERGSPWVLTPARQLLRSGADRHRGYAATWFGLALALVTLTIVFTRRRLNA